MGLTDKNLRTSDKEHVDSSVGLRGGVGGLPHVPLDQEDNFQFDSSVGLRGGVGGLPYVPLYQEEEEEEEEDNFQFDSLIASGDKEKESEGEKVVVVDKVSSDIVDLRTNNFVADGVITKYLKHLSSTKLNNDDEVYLADATVSSAYAQDASAINVELLRRSRLVLLPVNNNTNFGRADMGTHWSLFLIDAINGPPPQFYHMDSLDGLNRSAADRLATALGAVFPDAPGVVQVSTPRQKKSYDCAIYVMALAKSIITWWKSRTESTKHWMQMIQTDVTEENVHTLRHDFADRLEQDEKNQKVECNKEEKAKE
ncbi:NEDD8-specific protease 1-like [Triticum urartu]|uniref:NEDD8-specific protease 1-like n=1 Tax=Triticum urartu TaxID=4572 RepID=UPI002044261D|nr:NEDD8-specific protease 1-like [Triticum urartu]